MDACDESIISEADTQDINDITFPGSFGTEYSHDHH